MTDEEIRQAMEYCFEAKPGLCAECPIYKQCRTVDPDALGEMFERLMKEGSKNNDV